jgi:hypothetical protein
MFAQQQEFILIDVRYKAPYNVQVEPIDLRVAYIPNNKNLEQNGLFLSRSKITNQC